jgi:hypothetical protein
MKTPKIPHSDSIEALARFWDTHDLTDFEDEFSNSRRVITPSNHRDIRVAFS